MSVEQPLISPGSAKNNSVCRAALGFAPVCLLQQCTIWVGKEVEILEGVRMWMVCLRGASLKRRTIIFVSISKWQGYFVRCLD